MSVPSVRLSFEGVIFAADFKSILCWDFLVALVLVDCNSRSVRIMLEKILWLAAPVLIELEALRVILVCDLLRLVPLQVRIFADYVAVVELNIECVL